MKQLRKNRFSPAEARKSKREARIIAVSLFLIVFLTLAEFQLSDISPAAPGVGNIFIFGLINIILLLIILLVYLVFRNVARIILERRRNPFGSRLRGKLVVAFVGLSFVPTILLFFVSASFINMTIKNWLERQVEQSLSGSLEIAHAYYRDAGARALHFGRLTGTVLGERGYLERRSAQGLGDYLGKARQDYNVGIMEVFSPGRETLARSVSRDIPAGEYLGLSHEDLDLALAGKEFSRVNSAGKADIIRGIVPIFSASGSRRVVGVVAVGYYVPNSLAGTVSLLSGAYEKYRELKLLKSPIRGGYILTLFLITLVIIFLAVWFGVYLANSLTTPIQELSQATRQVAEGNLDVRLEGEGEDEIGMLVASFNKMTEDLRSHQRALSDANQELTRSNQELEQRRRYMEFILGNVTAGVISVNRDGVLTTINPSAERLLSISSESVLGRPFQEVLRPEQQEITRGLLRDLAESGKDTISRHVDVRMREGKRTLSVNLSVMRDEKGEFIGTVAVFDDLTQVLKAQRMAAWREVARRIAHEIKNPLTPIKLSAQRLRRKYLSRFGEDEKAFDECTGMIIKSVDELKILVDEFSSFARMPAAQPTPNSLNDVIREAVTLYQESHRQVSFRFSADETLPPILLDRDQIKRVLINLLDNAVDALGPEGGSIDIETGYNPELGIATFTVADTGHGISAEDKPRL
ncbi:MAG: HAMP domain-containing protein, partial [Geobacteraceae bacterium]|nr:HAMP domain-containing protein [Geobacteraceae bacterium]